jgi:hypothetical protein
LNTTKSRKLKRYVRNVFLRALWITISPVLRRLATSKFISLTCLRWDGGGAQIHARYSVETFARTFGFNYWQQSITTVLPKTSDSILQNWNALIGQSLEEINQIPAGTLTKTNGLGDALFKALIARLRRIPIILVLDQCHNFTDVFPGKLAFYAPEFRERAEKALCSWEKEFKKPTPHIVMHLRRGLISDGSDSLRVTPDANVLHQIAMLNRLYPGEKIKVFCFQTEPELERVLPDNVEFDSNSSEFEVVLSCSRAKVFVMAKSSLSYVAGLLNPNTVYYQEFWHPKIDEWKKI